MSSQNSEDLFESTKMTFGEHLEELRRSLFKALAALVIGTLIGLIFARNLVEYIQTPLRAALIEYYQALAKREYQGKLEQEQDAGLSVPEDLEAAAELYASKGLIPEVRFLRDSELWEILKERFSEVLDAEALAAMETSDEHDLFPQDDLIGITLYLPLANDPRIKTVALGVEEPFVVFMKAAILLGIVLSSPFVFYFIWAFVAAGLYPHEKRYVHMFLPFSVGLFLTGALLAFYVVFQYVLKFLLTFNLWMGINPEPRITEFLNLVLMLPVGFGIGFQLPLVMLFLERIGIFTVAVYQKQWRIAILIISVLSTILTPADWQSMVFMFICLSLLYCLGIGLCLYMPRRRTPFGEEIE